MSDNGEEDADEPVVELGDGDAVEGAPVSRIASRLFFPIEKSEIVRRAGETTIRTPEGPQALEGVLDRSDEVYFETSQDLMGAVQSVVGTGPVPTAGDGGSGGGSDASTDGAGAGEDVDADESEFEFDEE